MHLAKGNMELSKSWEALTVEEALASLERMPHLPSVDNVTYVLHKCRKVKNLACVKRLHAYMCKSGLEDHRSLGNYLVSMLAQAGSMDDAQQVFNRLVDRNVCSWTGLIMGYVECEESQHALILYQKMQEDSVQPSKYTFVALLKACTGLEDVVTGQELHAEIVRKGLERELFVGSALVDMYAKCGLLVKAQEAFDKLSVRDEVSWTALIAGYAEHGLGEEALKFFEQMQMEGIYPDAFTFVCSLKACSSIRAIDKGRQIHAEITRKGFERGLFVGSTLVDMYVKCDSLAEAQKAFDRLPVRNEVSWNALIAGYAEHGLGEEALNCFEQMQLEGMSPNAVTFVCSLKACGSIEAIDKGQEIHAEIGRKGLERDIFVGSALVDMYAKCGLIAKAREAFDRLAVRSEVSWNVLITGFAEHGLGEEALNCFQQMQLEGVSPNIITYVCSLKGCGSIGAIEKGQEIHAEIARKGLERDLFVGSTLVDMYAKCGGLAKAQKVFHNLPVRNEVSWNALIAGYALLGESEIVFHLLVRMRGEGVQPDGVTFLIVLTVCNYTGLVDKGEEYFEAMRKDYGIIPTIEHHTSMVDLLGRAGQLDKAVAMVKKMPFHPNHRVWQTVLDACRKSGNVKLGRHVFEQTVQLDEKNASAYVLMSNIYANAHMQENKMRDNHLPFFRHRLWRRKEKHIGNMDQHDGNDE